MKNTTCQLPRTRSYTYLSGLSIDSISLLQEIAGNLLTHWAYMGKTVPNDAIWRNRPGVPDDLPSFVAKCNHTV